MSVQAALHNNVCAVHAAGREESEEAPPGDTSFASDMDRREAGKDA